MTNPPTRIRDLAATASAGTLPGAAFDGLDLATRNQLTMARMHEIVREQNREYTDAQLAEMAPLDCLRACMREALRTVYARRNELEVQGEFGNDEDCQLRAFICRLEKAMHRIQPAA